jgi:hypothetical protein
MLISPGIIALISAACPAYVNPHSCIRTITADFITSLRTSRELVLSRNVLPSYTKECGLDYLLTVWLLRNIEPTALN